MTGNEDSLLTRMISGFIVVLAVALAAKSFGYDRGVWFFVFGIAAYGVGVLAAPRRNRKDADLEQYLESDWRHFEMLIELTPENIAKLQSLTRQPYQKTEALAWLEKQWTLKPGKAEQLLWFFVTSGWSSGGDAHHAGDTDWKWENVESLRQT